MSAMTFPLQRFIPVSLRRARLKLEMTQEELGAKVGAHRNDVSAWEGGREHLDGIRAIQIGRFTRSPELMLLGACEATGMIPPPPVGNRYDPHRAVHWMRVRRQDSRSDKALETLEPLLSRSSLTEDEQRAAEAALVEGGKEAGSWFRLMAAYCEWQGKDMGQLCERIIDQLMADDR